MRCRRSVSSLPDKETEARSASSFLVSRVPSKGGYTAAPLPAGPDYREALNLSRRAAAISTD